MYVIFFYKKSLKKILKIEHIVSDIMVLHYNCKIMSKIIMHTKLSFSSAREIIAFWKIKKSEFNFPFVLVIITIVDLDVP